MRIKRLKLVGFKSFVEPAELRIETGLTGIVGPNGCGKSNLLEAIRWVMGEGSPKSLRGGGMEDVIFAGTASRPPRSFAEVTISSERDASDNIPGIIADDGDELEVTRRIERGAGSAYRANGRDVRAKDVALIFADAATGAHSPALVSQGRIGAIIAAKPQERRQMLEEAAGISGLHVRRKDAEQKLRAAENNLERLATILADMDARAGQLRRQAKQAERYRKLTREVSQAEARLIYVRWREAKIAADAARAEAEKASLAVAEAQKVQADLNAKQQEAVKKLANDRAVAMATRDAANTLSTRKVQLSGERDNILQRQADLSTQLERMAQDSNRESKLTRDGAAALKKLQEESAALAAQIKNTEEERPAITHAVENAERQARENEISLAKAMAEQARSDAERHVAQSALSNAQNRLDRATKERDRIADERAQLGDEDELAQQQKAAISAVRKLQDDINKSAAAGQEIEKQRAQLMAARDDAQSEVAAANAELAALTSEKGALERTLVRDDSPKAIDRIKVAPGYERALAAALGDDVNAAIGGDHGRRWVGDKSAELRNGPTNPLSNHVEAPAELMIRLSMTHIADEDDGRRLKTGEHLVTLGGRLRRWDGFISEDDGAATAEMLIRVNRLAELIDAVPQAEQKLRDREMDVQSLIDQITQVQEQVGIHMATRQNAENQLRQALRDADKFEDMLERLISAKKSLDERMAGADAELASANGEILAAQQKQADLPDSRHHGELVKKLSAEGDAIRHLLLQTQTDLSTLNQQIGLIRERRAVAMAEIRGWQERAGEAEQRIAEMNRRSAEISDEIKTMAGRPEVLANEIASLTKESENIATKLAGLQNAENSSEAALKSLESALSTAAETLSSARETRAGAQARAENQELRRIEMGRVSGERFECPPPILPEKMEFDEDQLNDAAMESATLEKLQASREHIGPVNLIAADELTQLEEEQAKGASESEELTQAIHRLRGSIGNLNREGRQRLLAAFEAVDGHFRRLFTTLFNGGQAHLALVDSDDPLEAGLEIMAQPPGKKLASLTLLSGGEQALTAVALIFGLFLTNPAPICVLDEVDAPLDDANIERFCDLLDVMNRETDTRYLIVTHNAVTMSRMHRLFGVTMVEQGVSRLVSVDLGGAEQLLAAE